MSFSRARLRALFVVPAGVLLVALIALGAQSEQPKPGADPAREGGAPPVVDTRTVPTSSEGSRCAQGWSSFDNPVMHYAMCVPPGWGFSRFTEVAPLTEIPMRSLENIRLLSANAFPWSPGTHPFDAIATKDIVDVELDLLQPGTLADDCTPAIADGARLPSCMQSYDAMGLPASSGPVRALKVVIPLLRAPRDDDEDGATAVARLQVIVRASAERLQRDGDLVWQLVDAIRPY